MVEEGDGGREGQQGSWMEGACDGHPVGGHVGGGGGALCCNEGVERQRIGTSIGVADIPLGAPEERGGIAGSQQNVAALGAMGLPQ